MKKYKRMRVSALFNCQCGKQWEELKSARELAYKHAERTGHFVTGQIATSYIYCK